MLRVLCLTLVLWVGIRSASTFGDKPEAFSLSRCERLKKEISQTTFSAYVSDGELKGWVIRNLPPSSLFGRSGVREKDILIALNEKPTLSAPVLKVELDRLCQREASLTVTRHGKIVLLNLWDPTR